MNAGMRDRARAQQVGPAATATGGTTSTTSARASPPSCGCARGCSPPAPRAVRNVPRLLAEAIALGDRMAGRIPTPELNRFLAEAVQARQPPRGHASRLGPAAPEADLHDPDRRAPAALCDPGQLARARHARLRLLHRESPARALRDGRRAADHRLRRARYSTRSRPPEKSSEGSSCVSVPDRRRVGHGRLDPAPFEARLPRAAGTVNRLAGLLQARPVEPIPKP